jgi:hypothetical protein
VPAAPARVKRGSARRDRKCGCVAFRPRMRAGHQCRRLWSCAMLRPTGAGSSAADATTQGVEEIRHDVLLSTISQVASRKPVGVNMQTDRPRSKSRPAARQVQSAPASVARPIVATRIVAETKRGRARHMSGAYYKPKCSSCGSRMLGHVGRAAAGRASPGALCALNVVRPRRRLLYPICRRTGLRPTATTLPIGARRWHAFECGGWGATVREQAGTAGCMEHYREATASCIPRQNLGDASEPT